MNILNPSGGTSDNPANSASSLIATLLGRAPRTATTLAAGQALWPLAMKLRAKMIENSTYTVKVLGTDDIYDDLHEWVLSLLPAEGQRALVAWTRNRDVMGNGISPDGPRPARIRLRYDGSREQTVRIGKFDIEVSVHDGQSQGDRMFKPDEIVFTARSMEGQRHLIAEIDAVLAKSRQMKRQPAFRMFNTWGDWQKLDEPMPRTLESVILAAGQMERLVADVQGFLDAESDHLRRCIPWHRGHLYEGPPGTGKTSVARALASHFGMDIWYLPLGDVKRDTDLIAALSRISPRSMLLLEDVDVFHAMTQRNDDADGITLSGLLNALDGIATPHGLFTVLTTNTPEVLDPAVIRPGRVDFTEHFGVADADQTRRLLERWYGKRVYGTTVGGASPAEISEICKRHHHPDDALRDIARSVMKGTP